MGVNPDFVIHFWCGSNPPGVVGNGGSGRRTAETKTGLATVSGHQARRTSTHFAADYTVGVHSTFRCFIWRSTMLCQVP